MDRKLFFKLTAIVFLTLLLMVPLGLIESQIRERSSLQDSVLRNIAQTAAGQQTLVGPVLLVRYRQYEREVVQASANVKEHTVRKVVQRSYLLPADKLHIHGDSTVESRSRGIYQARLYHVNLALEGSFTVPRNLGVAADSDLIDAQATLLLGISDLRGMDNDPEVLVNGGKFRFKEGKNGDIPGPQVAVELGAVDLIKGSRFDFAFPLNLTGTERLAIAPTAEANLIELGSNWRHPSFQGRFLPRSRDISANGFKATWEISHLARSFGKAIAANGPDGEREALEVTFMEPVNIYLQSERAVKYGSLFVVLTFAAFFLGEILKKRPMHFMQYLLVGLALAMFFLLLIALSEHASFALAYRVSALACIGLITVYLAGVLGGRRPALAFGAGYTGLYGVLYGVLLSEDNSLLMGSLLLFVALGAIMMSTRKVDWYQLGRIGESK